MKRRVSYSEITTALTCWARWDFAYGGRLAGDCLEPKRDLPLLSEGRAWGRGVAAWHQSGNLWHAICEMNDELNQARDLDTRIDMELHLGQMLADYAQRCDPILGLELLEKELRVFLPAATRSGHASSKYEFEGYIDGHGVVNTFPWLVEFKLRKALTPVDLIQKQPQYRWYAWALRETKGIEAVGILVDERLNEHAKPVRMVKGRKKSDGMIPSHASAQMTTPELYLAACEEFGEEPSTETLEHLRARVWQQRVPIIFRDGEIDEAGRELRDVVKLIGQLDSGALSPIRHATRPNCNGCRFKAICPAPEDTDYIDTLFDRKPPKRLRKE